MLRIPSRSSFPASKRLSKYVVLSVYDNMKMLSNLPSYIALHCDHEFVSLQDARLGFARNLTRVLRAVDWPESKPHQHAKHEASNGQHDDQTAPAGNQGTPLRSAASARSYLGAVFGSVQHVLASLLNLTILQCKAQAILACQALLTVCVFRDSKLPVNNHLNLRHHFYK